MLYKENLRAIEVKATNQTLWCLPTYHGAMLLKRKGKSMYIIDKRFWTSIMY